MIPFFGITLLFFFLTQSSAGELKFERYKTSDGLIQNNVFAIAQDSQGYMWFGTQDGVSRFDGYSFTTFQTTVDRTSLSSNVINALYVDRKGVLWVGTDGLHEYHPQTETFSRYLYSNSLEPENYIEARNSVRTIYQDRRNNLWIGNVYGISRFNQTTNTFEGFIPSDNFSLRCVLFEDSKGRFWLGTGESLYLLNEKRTSATKVMEPKIFSTSKIEVCSIKEDSFGNIWVATWSGLYRLDAISSSWKAFHHNPKDIHSLSNDHVNALFVDRDSTFWVGTHEGLDRFNYESETFTHHRHNPEQPTSLSNNRVHTIYQDASGVLWVGTFGGGVCKTIPFQRGFHTLRRPPLDNGNQRSNMIFSILEDNRGRVWMGSWEDGLSVYDRSKKKFTQHMFPGVTITTFMEKPEGKVWVGKRDSIPVIDENFFIVHTYPFTPNAQGTVTTKSGTVFGFLPREIYLFDETIGVFKGVTNWSNELFKFANNDIQTIFEDNDGQIWIVGKHLMKFNLEPLSTKRIEVSALKNDLNIAVMSILEDSSGIFWMATRGRGIVRYNKKTGESKRYSVAQGLPHNVVYGALEDNNHKIWFSTNNGLSRFDPLTERFTNYSVEDGLQENEFNTRAFFKNKQGELFFGGVNGVTYFFPDSIRDNKRAPEIVITGFKLFDRLLRYTDNITKSKPLTFSRDENFFAIEFAALDFMNPRENEFEYILEGFDPEWTYAGTRHQASYTNIPPGEYIFRVKGSNNDGVWNEEGTSIAITIIPAYWETPWFRVMVTLAILLTGPLVYYRRVTTLKREKTRQEEFSRELIESQERERKRIAAELHDGLGQELLIIKNKALLGLQDTSKENKQSMLEEISDSVSETLEVVSEISYSLRPYQLEYLGLTNALNALIKRAAASSTISFSKEIESIDGILPQHLEIDFYRVVQESINNILKHSQATKSHVILLKQEHHIALTIEDNGKGFDVNVAKMKKGFGLKGLYERVKMLHGELIIDSHEHSGTTLKITIPLKDTHGK
jgi:signal transduction histidine kinase/ligand-binding sensor domain-containing protein